MFSSKRRFKLIPGKTVVLLCDIQERYRRVIPLFPEICKNANRMILAANQLGVPVIATEQYPQRLGPIAHELDLSQVAAIIPKTQFSMLVPAVLSKIKELFPRKSLTDVIIFGVECHVCLEHTVLDLLARYNKMHVFLLADCSASRRNQDRDWAFARMVGYGCIVTTYESVISNMLVCMHHPRHDIVKYIIRDPPADVEVTPSTSKNPFFSWFS